MRATRTSATAMAARAAASALSVSVSSVRLRPTSTRSITTGTLWPCALRHRISTIEVESALVDHQEVAGAAVCGRKDERTGQAIVAFVSLKGGKEGSLE